MRLKTFPVKILVALCLLFVFLAGIFLFDCYIYSSTLRELLPKEANIVSPGYAVILSAFLQLILSFMISFILTVLVTILLEALKGKNILKKFLFLYSILFLLVYYSLSIFVWKQMSIKVDRAYNPVVAQNESGNPFQHFASSNVYEAYTYLKEIKEDFNIDKQDAALENFKRRLKSGETPVIYVIDDFKDYEAEISYLYKVIPIPTLYSHGEIVENVIRDTLGEELEKKVKIIPVDYKYLRTNKQQIHLDLDKKDPLVEILERIEKENPKRPVFINMSFGRYKYSPTSDEQIDSVIRLNNEGFVFFKSAGNLKVHTLTSLGVDEALGILLENYYVVGDSKHYQPGEKNIDGIAEVVFSNGAKLKLSGTSFSSPACLALFVKRLFHSGCFSGLSNK